MAWSVKGDEGGWTQEGACGCEESRAPNSSFGSRAADKVGRDGFHTVPTPQKRHFENADTQMG